MRATLSPSLDLRLRARAVAEGVTKAEIVRRAITRYLEAPGPAPSRRNAEKVDLAGLLQKQEQIPRSIARFYIAQGRVKVNGKTTEDFDIEVLPGEVVHLEVQK